MEAELRDDLDKRQVKIWRESPCPDCTGWQMAHGKGGWYRTRWLFNLIPWGKEWVRCDTCDGVGMIYSGRTLS